MPKRPPVPSYSPKNPKLKSQNMGGSNTARGTSSKVVNLKPIHHTEHKKFQPHPNNFKKFRTSLPPTLKKPVQTEISSPILQKDKPSPYQMMLEEMKNNER